MAGAQMDLPGDWPEYVPGSQTYAADGAEPEREEPTNWTSAVVVEAIRRRYPGHKNQWAVIPEFMNVDCLVVGLWGSTGYALIGFEIKVSRSDWLKELKLTGKAAIGLSSCDFWMVAAPDGVVRRDEVPKGWGYLAIGRRSMVVVKPPRLHPVVGWESVKEPHTGALVDASPRAILGAMARRFAYADADARALGRLGSAPVEEWPDHYVAERQQAYAETGRLDGAWSLANEQRRRDREEVSVP
jgi:hypothetical protein